jgi:hypothetical protein
MKNCLRDISGGREYAGQAQRMVLARPCRAATMEERDATGCTRRGNGDGWSAWRTCTRRSPGSPDKLLLGRNKKKQKRPALLSLRVELKTSRLLNGCSNQLSYESFDALFFKSLYLLVNLCNL